MIIFLNFHVVNGWDEIVRLQRLNMRWNYCNHENTLDEYWLNNMNKLLICNMNIKLWEYIVYRGTTV
jgi:hypothetical protein